jgi:hypothetical protein
LAGGFFTAAFGVPSAFYAASFSARNSLRFNLVRAMVRPRLSSETGKPSILTDFGRSCQMGIHGLANGGEPLILTQGEVDGNRLPLATNL